MSEEKVLDEAQAFEEHFLVAYLLGIERCEEVRLRVPLRGTKHPSLAAVGYSPRKRAWVGCDVLDWCDGWWPKEMNPEKVVPKLRERVALFGDHAALAEAMSRRSTVPKLRFLFAGLGKLSPRIITAVPALGGSVTVGGAVPPMSGEFRVEVLGLYGARLQDVTRALGAFALTAEAPEGNHFVRAARLLAEAGWRPE